MADTLKTYNLICPDTDCDEEFDIERVPGTLVEGDECIQCPVCGEEWEWEYDAEADTLQLLAGEDELDTDLLEDTEDDEEDDDG
jgi:hypothetical protein